MYYYYNYFMSVELPPCPFNPVDRDILRHYIEREQEIDAYRARGKRALRSTAVALLLSQQRGARDIDPELLTPENIGIYRLWVDEIATSIELKNDSATDTAIAVI